MDYSKLEYFISQPRLERFLKAADNSKIKAQQIYRINLRVSQAFYPILNLFEIFLRNTVNYQIREFRNRIYHNEPICFDNHHVDFSEAELIKDAIYELLNWIDTDLSKYCNYFNNISSKIQTINNL